MKNEKIILSILFVLIIAINYSWLNIVLENSFEQEYETGVVQRIIDGDTIKIGNESVRLLGINSPEKGEKYSKEATGFLTNTILNKTVRIYFESEKYDLYDRKLGYIFLENKNINLESVRKGYSNFYFPQGKTKYYYQFKEAWEDCMIENKNLCEASENNCILLKQWKVSTQTVILENICSNDVNLGGWLIKDEGRKKYIFEKTILKQNEEIILTNEDWGKTYVWTKSGDSIFLRDNDGKLVFYSTY